jgi:hypothetical protein
MWKRDLLPDAEAYAWRRGLELTGRLGDGADGNVWKVRGKRKHVSWALKLQAGTAGYQRERDCYERLGEHGVSEIAGFHVPQLIRSDDEWNAIEMSIVTRPFILDFAQAYLDEMPEFPDEVWEERLETWQEIYAEDWHQVSRALRELRCLGIHYLDVHHQNIALPL